MAFNKRKEISWHENCLLWVTLSLIQQDKAWYQFVKIITNNLFLASIIPPSLIPKCLCEYIFMLNICSSTIHRTTYFTVFIHFFKSLEIGHLKAVNKLLKHWQWKPNAGSHFSTSSSSLKTWETHSYVGKILITCIFLPSCPKPSIFTNICF